MSDADEGSTVPARQEDPPPGEPWGEPSGAERFWGGAVLGCLLAGTLATVVGLLTLGVFGIYAYRSFTDALNFDINPPALSSAVESSTPPVVTVNMDGTTHLVGWADGSGSYPVDTFDDSTVDTSAVGTIGIAIPVVSGRVAAVYRVPVYLTADTKFTRNGKPWNPPGDGSKSPAVRLLAQEFPPSEDAPAPGTTPLEESELTVDAKRVGDTLVALTVDLNTNVGAAPMSIY